MEQLKKFLEFLRTDAKALEILASKEKPESPEEIIRNYAEVAKQFGFSLTKEEIAEGIKALTEEQVSRTAQAEEAAQELDLDELKKVAGGVDNPAAVEAIASSTEKQPGCKYSFKHGENCWFQDGCDHAIWTYQDYICKRQDHDGNKCSQLY